MVGRRLQFLLSLLLVSESVSKAPTPDEFLRLLNSIHSSNADIEGKGISSRAGIAEIAELENFVEKALTQEKDQGDTVDQAKRKLEQLTSVPRDASSSLGLSQDAGRLLGALGRQMMMQQLFMEERIRSDESSGLKQMRLVSTGTKLYNSNTATGFRKVVAIHNHANNIRTVGMGEVIAVLNGVQFRTRHNDYRLMMPVEHDKAFEAVQEVPFPEVPPAVLNAGSVEDQIQELQIWFKAWKEQDINIRDYRPYFKPVLVYMEGAWTAPSASIDEPFFSDRHFLDAESWYELHEKIRFASYTGGKSQLENIAFLPTKFINLTGGIIPKVAQWNYRILCHPIKNDIPTGNLRVRDDLVARANNGKTMASHASTRSARFQLDPEGANWTKGESKSKYGLLDELMYQIPGMDNYGAVLRDDAGGLEALDLQKEPLNAAYYHRVYGVAQADAMGEKERFRGYNDPNVYFAMNSQPHIAGMDMEYCNRRKRNCKTINQKWSYAIPLEILYLTPLLKWNPYNIPYKGDSKSEGGKAVTSDDRNGEPTPDKAYNGSNSRVYYRTPVAFTAAGESMIDKADTTGGQTGVLDGAGNMHLTIASGTRIHLPFIPGVGVVRTRYPIAPFTTEGSNTMKELEVLKDMVSEQHNFLHLYREPPVASSEVSLSENDPKITFLTGKSTRDTVVPHTHSFTLLNSTVQKLVETMEPIMVFTDPSEGHNHKMIITYKVRRTYQTFVVLSCDDSFAKCKDRHGIFLFPQGGGWK